MVVSLHDHQNTFTHIEGKCGGLQFCCSKTLTDIEVNCGGGWLLELETLPHDSICYSLAAPCFKLKMEIRPLRCYYP